MTTDKCHGCNRLAADAGRLFAVDVEPDGDGPWRVAAVCRQCLNDLEVDAWASESCWIKMAARTPFALLPILPVSA